MSLYLDAQTKDEITVFPYFPKRIISAINLVILFPGGNIVGTKML